MKLHGYEVKIVEGKETENGYVEMEHGRTYRVELRNEHGRRCDVEVKIDGGTVGTFRLEAKGRVSIERPVHDAGKFTFFRAGTPEAVSAGIVKGQETGLITATFMPEEPFKTFGLCASKAPGGTGLTGKSEQKFTTVNALNYAPQREWVTINLRLVGTKADAPRPLHPRMNLVPPPVG